LSAAEITATRYARVGEEDAERTAEALERALFGT
jgi:hypothetical protein